AMLSGDWNRIHVDAEYASGTEFGQRVVHGVCSLAIMGGLILATALTLLFLPALYAAWFRVKKPVEVAKGEA
ncbi:MaoC/PaaZ C-terminal domain-containing protein, partial [Janthinobacterium sp.]|uniref:MaoC/PaaZ C-terminal domain-containing protein n=1 Tax=Janthinobacterium sp. TaxID=1871054 RepID=UPI0025841E97